MGVSKGSYLWRGLSSGLIFATIHSSAWATSIINGIDFNGVSDPPEIKIDADSALDAETQKGSSNQEFFIVIKGSRFSGGASSPVDTSSFGTVVKSIRPVVAGQDSEVARILVETSESVTPELIPSGNSLLVKVKKDEPNLGKADSSDLPSLAAVSTQKQGGAPKPDRLDELLTSRETKKFKGKPVTLKLRDTNLSDVFKLIGDASGFNVILGKEVSGKITLSLEEVPWDQALDIVLRMAGLGAERSENILRIMSLKSLTDEKQQELAASRAITAITPKITRSFPINYANLNELSASLQKFTSTSNGSSSSLGQDDPVVIQPDSRTNSIIIHDIPKSIEQLRKLIEVLDAPTPQIMIEAKVVEVTESFGKTLSGSLGVGGASGTAFASFAGANPIDALVGSPGVFSGGSAISQVSGAARAANGTFGFSPSITFLNSTLRLNAILGIGESESQVKVMSAPKTVVLNRQKASILSSTPMLTPALISTQMGPQASLQVSQANLSLVVTPTVTNDASVLMDLNVSKDLPYPVTSGNLSGNAVAQRNLQTQVLVDSGTTLVIGGIYSLSSQHDATGFPVLRNIPVIGGLFGSEATSETRSELLIFVTPRILNSKEIISGGSS